MIEFQTKLSNGIITIPVKLRKTVGGNVKVIIIPQSNNHSAEIVKKMNGIYKKSLVSDKN